MTAQKTGFDRDQSLTDHKTGFDRDQSLTDHKTGFCHRVKTKARLMPKASDV
jgi:hypothetical protein